MKLLIAPIVLLPLTGGLLLNSLSVDNKYPHARLVEVYFYNKQTSATSATSEQKERIKVWIENLDDFSKYEFYKNDNTNKWLRFSEVQDSDKKKYTTLAKIAKLFFQNQHNLNIAKGIYLIKNGDAKIECKSDCKNKPDCCLKDCPNLINDHRVFYYHLSNLESASNNSYLSPVQAHINLGDIKLDNSDHQNQEKQISGSLVYGYVDYQYRLKQSSNLKVPEDKKQFYKLSSSNNQTNDNKKYFANYPTTYSITLDKDLKIKENGSSENDLIKVNKKLNAKKEISALIKDKNVLKFCCCEGEPKPNTFDCLLSSNFVKIEENLNTIQEWVKSNWSCQKNN